MEALINRIRSMMMYVDVGQIYEKLEKEGIDRPTIFLAYCAAERLNKIE